MSFDPKPGEHDLAAVLTLELLFRTEMQFVMNTARRCGLSDADAEDVTQRVFITLQGRLHTLHSPESVRPWLATVTRRFAHALAGTQYRWSTDETVVADLDEIEDEGPLPEEQMLRSERQRELLALVESIEPRRRMIFVMHVLDELPVAQIAATLQIPVATAYNRLRLARQDLRDVLARKNLVDEYGVLLRSWSSILAVRDPFERCYGQAEITPSAQERIWASVLEALRETHASLEAAERTGLRIHSPLFRADAPPRPYASLKRARRSARGARAPRLAKAA